MILKVAWVVPVTAPALRHGFVRIAGERIVAVGTADTPPASSEPVFDLGDVMLTPGLVNPHTHLELTCYAGQLEPAPFWLWLPRLVKLRAMPGQVEREQQGVHEGAWQSLRAGVTCIGDISRRNLHWPVLKRIPVRKVCFVELLTLADDPPRNPAELRAAVAEVDEDPLLTVGVTPHAPYSVPADQIRAALALASELGRPWCTHWAETPAEVAFLRGNTSALPGFVRTLLAQCQVHSPRRSPIELLEYCTDIAGIVGRVRRPDGQAAPARAKPGALAHFNYAEPGDAERLAAAGHVVVYCPRAHRFFGHEPHPYRTMMQIGVTVAIGTDSVASNENLALLEELRFLRRHTPNPPPHDVLLRMVTLDAARALGLHAQIGSLEVGKQADLAAFPCGPDVADPLAALLDSAPAPTGVWVAGQRVV